MPFRDSRHIAIRVVSPCERLHLGVGAYRRLDHAVIDRLVLLACAAVGCRIGRKPPSLGEVARLLGLPVGVVREAVARHVVVDGPDDSWVAFNKDCPQTAIDCEEHVTYEAQRLACQACGEECDLEQAYSSGDMRLRMVNPGWPHAMVGYALRHWPDDFIALVADVVVRCPEEEFGFAAWLLGVVLDSLDPDWSTDLLARGLNLVRGNLSDRAMDMQGPAEHPPSDFDPDRRPRFSPDARTALRERLGKRLLLLDLGGLPERILASSPEGFDSAGLLVCVLFNSATGITERLEQRFFAGDGLFELLGTIVDADPSALPDGIGLLYDMVTGSEKGPQHFVEVLRARRGYDLPRPLHKPLMERLSVGLAAIAEAVDTADPEMNVEVSRIFRRWREELEPLMRRHFPGCDSLPGREAHPWTVQPDRSFERLE